MAQCPESAPREKDAPGRLRLLKKSKPLSAFTRSNCERQGGAGRRCHPVDRSVDRNGGGRSVYPSGRTGLSSLILEVVSVYLGVFGPLGRKLILGKTPVNRGNLDAGVAVDALVRVDVELLDVVVVGLVRRRVDAVDGTNLDARVVLLAYARLGDDVGHWEVLLSSFSGCPPGAPAKRERSF